MNYFKFPTKQIEQSYELLLREYLMCDEPVPRDKHFGQTDYNADCQVSCTLSRHMEGKITTTVAVSDRKVFDKRTMLQHIIVLYVMNHPQYQC
jgi:hypothetical protein